MKPRSTRSGLLIWIPLAFIAFLGGIFLYRLAEPKDDFIRSHMIGQPLPAFTFPAATAGVDGLSNKDFADGKPRMLNLFGSWCTPCIAEAPMLEQLKAQGVEIHAIALNDKPENVSAFLNQNGNPYDRIGSADMAFQLQLGSAGVPETFIIDGKGRIVYQHIGDIRAEHVAPLLAKWRAAK
jgi:cytochrome c biogenesis protein CcmG, thiol:disulfide interchange protein DsbE